MSRVEERRGKRGEERRDQVKIFEEERVQDRREEERMG